MISHRHSNQPGNSKSTRPEDDHPGDRQQAHVPAVLYGNLRLRRRCAGAARPFDQPALLIAVDNAASEPEEGLADFPAGAQPPESVQQYGRLSGDACPSPEPRSVLRRADDGMIPAFGPACRRYGPLHHSFNRDPEASDKPSDNDPRQHPTERDVPRHRGFSDLR
jgi:hypothetical protein